MIPLLQGLEGRIYLKQKSSLLFSCVSEEPGSPATLELLAGQAKLLVLWVLSKWVSWGPFQACLQRNKCLQYQLEKHGVNSCGNAALPGSQCISHMLAFQLALTICRKRMGSKGVITEMGLPSSDVKRIISVLTVVTWPVQAWSLFLCQIAVISNF